MLREITELLRNGGISNYIQEARWITEKAKDLKTAKNMAKKRIDGIPLQYVLGEWDFYNITIKTIPGAFIPRPETEELVEYALSIAKGINNPRIIDLCTGTGAIALALTHNLKNSEIYALEFSEDAITVLNKNIKNTKVTPIYGDVFNSYNLGLFDIITCNPPYLDDYDIKNLDSSVKDPLFSLQGQQNPDGLRYYRDITRIWKKHLKNNGVIIYEIGESQAKEVADILKEYGFTDIEIFKDLCGKDRIIKGKII